MKKLTALLLVLVLICSLSVTAFAAGEQTGTTTISVTVPEASYTIHIPADMELEYGKTDVQVIGDVYVSDVVGVKTSIWVNTYLSFLTNDNGDRIPVYWYMGRDKLPVHDVTLNGFAMITIDSMLYSAPGTSDGEAECFCRLGCLITGSDWNAAAPGTYTATISFAFFIDD